MEFLSPFHVSERWCEMEKEGIKKILLHMVQKQLDLFIGKGILSFCQINQFAESFSDRAAAEISQHVLCVFEASQYRFHFNRGFADFKKSFRNMKAYCGVFCSASVRQFIEVNCAPLSSVADAFHGSLFHNRPFMT